MTWSDFTALLPDPATHPALYVVAGVVVLFGVVGRWVPVLRTLLSLASWVAIGGLLLVTLGQREALDPYLGRAAAALNLGGQEVVGRETRVRMSPDGHFWVRATIGGVERRLMVDSGATVTALSTKTAEAAGLKPKAGLVPVVLQTANGAVRAETATVDELRFGNVVARDLAVVVSPAFGDMNVLGMNFLSRLKSWRVEGSTLVLVPNHPQEVDS